MEKERSRDMQAIHALNFDSKPAMCISGFVRRVSAFSLNDLVLDLHLFSLPSKSGQQRSIHVSKSIWGGEINEYLKQDHLTRRQKLLEQIKEYASLASNQNWMHGVPTYL